ncbi:hypothetical protein V2G26_011054 [Clonostachys chloroleuca]
MKSRLWAADVKPRAFRPFHNRRRMPTTYRVSPLEGPPEKQSETLFLTAHGLKVVETLKPADEEYMSISGCAHYDRSTDSPPTYIPFYLAYPIPICLATTTEL